MLSTVHIKHNFFYQNQLGRNLGLQNTHIDFLKSPSDVMQVSELSATLGIGSELVDWYQDATSLTYRCFDCLVATNRQSITLLYKLWICSPKMFYPGPVETNKPTFG